MADSPTEITKKIEDAYNAQKTWANTSFHDRRRVMRSLKKWLVDNQETCAKVACRDTGKTSESVVALSASLQCAGAHVAA